MKTEHFDIYFRLPDGRLLDDINIDPGEGFIQMIADLALEALANQTKEETVHG